MFLRLISATLLLASLALPSTALQLVADPSSQGTGFAEAVCPANTRPINGGCRIDGSGAFVNSSRANEANNSWQCTATDETVTIIARAFCVADIEAPGWEVVENVATVDHSNRLSAARASCPSDKELIGGGCSSSDLLDALHSSSRRFALPDGRQWSCEWTRSDSLQSTSTAQAICIDRGTVDLQFDELHGELAAGQSELFSTPFCPIRVPFLGGGCQNDSDENHGLTLIQSTGLVGFPDLGIQACVWSSIGEVTGSEDSSGSAVAVQYFCRGQ